MSDSPMLSTLTLPPDLEGSEALVAFVLEPYVEMVNDLARSRRASRSKKSDTTPTPPAGAPGTP